MGLTLGDIATAVSVAIAGIVLVWAIATLARDRSAHVSAGRLLADPAVTRYPSETYCRACGTYMYRRNAAVWYVSRDRRRCTAGRIHVPADAPESYALIVARLGY